MLDAMPLVDVQHFVKNVCRKRSYAPTLALTQVKWGPKVSLGAQPTFFWINLRNNVDRIKDGQVVFDEVSFEEVFIVLWCMKNCTTFWLLLYIRTLAGGQVVGARRTLQPPDITLTSKPWLEARSLLLGRGYNSLTVSRHQIPAFKPLCGALKTEYPSKTPQLSARA